MTTNVAYYNSSYSSTNRKADRNAYWPFNASVTSHLAQRTVKSQISSLLKVLVRQLTGSSEPRVWSSTDANGETLWNAVDMASDRTLRNATETEMRIWLEERYTRA